MSQQTNKVIKRQRRAALLKRRKQRAKLNKGTKAAKA
jgi:hypothetical protein